VVSVAEFDFRYNNRTKLGVKSRKSEIGHLDMRRPQSNRYDNSNIILAGWIANWLIESVDLHGRFGN